MTPQAYFPYKMRDESKGLDTVLVGLLGAFKDRIAKLVPPQARGVPRPRTMIMSRVRSVLVSLSCEMPAVDRFKPHNRQNYKLFSLLFVK